MNLPNNNFLSGAHPWQLAFLKAFDQGWARFSMLPWHRRGRKTTLAINLLIREACKHPRCIYDYVAPTYRQAKSIIWRNPEMLFNYLPDKSDMGWEQNESELFIRFANDSLLQIKGSDKPDSLRGSNVHGVVFDEWAEMKEETWQAIYRPIIAESPDRWANFIFTPKGQNHAFVQWMRVQDDPDWYTSLLDATMSDLIPSEELEKARKEMPPALFDQEFMCRFVTDEELTLITSAMLAALENVERHRVDTRKIISCDPATGGDECPIQVIVDTRIEEQKILNYRDTMKIVGELMLMSSKHGINNFIVDSIGLGKGIADRLSELGKYVQHFCSSEKSRYKDRYANKKAEAWWYVAQLVRDLKVVYPQDVELRRQVSSVQYQLTDSSGKLKITEKQKTKDILGCSPDRADTWVMGIYGLQYVEPENEKKRDSYEEEDDMSVMSMSL